MKLDWAMIANHAEMVNGLAYIAGGALDTIVAQTLPATYNGSIALRFLLHRTEIDKVHTIELRIVTGDGGEIGRLNSSVGPLKLDPDLPIAWEYKTVVGVSLVGLPLSKAGEYSVEILADGIHHKSLPFRVKLVPPPPDGS